MNQIDHDAKLPLYHQLYEILHEKLRIRTGEELAQIKQLRLADSKPVCIENSHFVHKYCRGILEHDFSVRSLRQVKIDKYGIRWTPARQTIRAVSAVAEMVEAGVIVDSKKASGCPPKQESHISLQTLRKDRGNDSVK